MPDEKASFGLLPGSSDALSMGPIPRSRQEVEREMKLYYYSQIAPGTRFRVDTLRRVSEFAGDDTFKVFARVLDGPFAGETVCVYDFYHYEPSQTTFNEPLVAADPKLFVPCDVSGAKWENRGP
jgi:hypothetical protein